MPIASLLRRLCSPAGPRRDPSCSPTRPGGPSSSCCQWPPGLPWACNPFQASTLHYEHFFMTLAFCLMPGGTWVLCYPHTAYTWRNLGPCDLKGSQEGAIYTSPAPWQIHIFILGFILLPGHSSGLCLGADHQHHARCPFTSIMALCQSWSFLYLFLATWCHVLRLVALVGAAWNLGFDGYKGLWI